MTKKIPKHDESKRLPALQPGRRSKREELAKRYKTIIEKSWPGGKDVPSPYEPSIYKDDE